MEEPILVAHHPGYRVITLNRPQRLNAVTEAMHRSLKAALSAAEEDDNCRALLLTGAGRGFCAGQDLNERLSKDGQTTVLGNALETFGDAGLHEKVPGRNYNFYFLFHGVVQHSLYHAGQIALLKKMVG